MYSSTNKLTHICTIQPKNTTLPAFRQPYTSSILPWFFVHISRSRELITVPSLSQQRPTVNMARKCQETGQLLKTTNFGHLWPPEGYNLANVAKKIESFLKTTLTSMKCIQWSVFQMMVESHPFPAIFRPPEGKKWSKWPNNYSFLKTCTISEYTKYEVFWMISILDNGLKP